MRKLTWIPPIALLLATLASSSNHSQAAAPEEHFGWLECGGPLASGCAAFALRDFQVAVREFSVIATDDEGPWRLHAAYNLGVLYELGAGLPPSLQQARLAYEAASLQGIPKAQLRHAAFLATQCRRISCGLPGYDPRAEASAWLRHLDRRVSSP